MLGRFTQNVAHVEDDFIERDTISQREHCAIEDRNKEKTTDDKLIVPEIDYLLIHPAPPPPSEEIDIAKQPNSRCERNAVYTYSLTNRSKRTHKVSSTMHRAKKHQSTRAL